MNDVPVLRDLLDRLTRRRRARAMRRRFEALDRRDMHELGHVVGLAHVASRNELMYKSATRADFGPGDLEGLARLGTVPCG